MTSPERRGARTGGGRRWLRALGSVLYWLVVLVISLALVVALVLFLESRDESEVGGPAGRVPERSAAAPQPARRAASVRSRRANTTIRWAAL
jgi:hypothetical protein